jgi:hypothetical protein
LLNASEVSEAESFVFVPASVDGCAVADKSVPARAGSLADRVTCGDVMVVGEAIAVAEAEAMWMGGGTRARNSAGAGLDERESAVDGMELIGIGDIGVEPADVMV